MCAPFLTQAKATQALLQCETEGLLPSNTYPPNGLLKNNNLSGIEKPLSLTLNVPDITS